MVNTLVTLVGAKELKAAITRNPKKVADLTKDFLQHSMRKYRQGIMRKPWQVGGSGGGAPVELRGLVTSHMTVVNKWSARIGPNEKDILYARYVHGGTRNMKARPWLDYVKEKNERAVQSLYRALLTNVTKDLAR